MRIKISFYIIFFFHSAIFFSACRRQPDLHIVTMSIGAEEAVSFGAAPLTSSEVIKAKPGDKQQVSVFQIWDSDSDQARISITAEFLPSSDEQFQLKVLVDSQVSFKFNVVAEGKTHIMLLSGDHVPAADFFVSPTVTEFTVVVSP